MARLSLAWVVGYAMRQFTCPKAVTHPTTNGAQCRATVLIETNALPLHKTVNILREWTLYGVSLSTNAVSEIHVGDVVELS